MARGVEPLADRLDRRDTLLFEDLRVLREDPFDPLYKRYRVALSRVILKRSPQVVVERQEVEDLPVGDPLFRHGGLA